jgi:S-adenosylmethionine:tRNA-ribosyltransferase-isomerase (queuine synthetase)
MAAKFATTRPNTKLVLKDGTELYFTGKYLILDNEAHIAEIRDELNYFAGTVTEVDITAAEHEDPIAKIRERAIADYIASQKAKDAEHQVVTVDNTAKVAAVTAGIMNTESITKITANSKSSK